jgi:hypothetical protein
MTKASGNEELKGIPINPHPELAGIPAGELGTSSLANVDPPSVEENGMSTTRQNICLERRESGKLIIAGILACGTWSVLGWLICVQFQNSVSFAEKIAALPPTDKDRINIIKEANDTVNKTSSSLYAFITPFATAISGYFFISSSNLLTKKDDSKDRNSKNNDSKNK